jgi:predicted dehydrogenase
MNSHLSSTSHSADSPRITLTRREFATCAVAASIGTQLSTSAASEAERAPTDNRRWRVAIIGHTGQGDYGHSHDVAFTDRPDTEVVAVADPDEAGRNKAITRSKAARGYADYREMLAKEKPQLVALASRWSHERHATGRAALEAGAHIYSEKPFTETLAEADDLLALAERQHAKIAVAHQIRLAPSTVQMKKALGEGLIGELLEIRAWGKQDDRAGGEDMIVLGSHLFDLMRLFAGDPLWCSARVLSQGHDITRADARRVNEQIGPVAGDSVQAHFAFPNGVNGSFTSRKALRETIGPWGIEFVGSKGKARMLVEIFPSLYVLASAKWDAHGREEKWQRLASDPGLALSAEERGFGPGNRRVVDDWLAAIRDDREPACSGEAATKSLEMIMAVYRSALSGQRAMFPLAERGHPLAG